MNLAESHPTFRRPAAAVVRRLAALVRGLPRLLPWRWWTWKTTRRMLLGAAVFASLVAAAYVVENWRGRRAYAAFVREAEAAGVSLDLADYAPPPVPDANNLAKLPLLDHPLGDEQAWTDVWRRYGRRPERKMADGPEFSAAGAPAFAVDEPADLAAYREAFAASEGEGFDEYLQRLAPEIAALDAATTTRVTLRYDYDLAKLYDVRLPQVGTMRRFARVAIWRALVDLEAGRSADAARHLRIALRMADAQADEPFLISQLTAKSMRGLAVSAIWHGQRAHRWTEAELTLLADVLAENRGLERFQRALQLESAMAQTYLRQVATNRDRARLAALTGGLSGGVGALVSAGPSGWLWHNAAAVGRDSLSRITGAINPAEHRVRPVEATNSEPEPKTGFTPCRVVADVIASSMGRLPFGAGESQGMLDLARLAVALERHRLAHGEYPETLAEATAGDAELATLRDVFSGAPYRYRRESDGGFTLWGVNTNGRDEEGLFPKRHDGDRAEHYSKNMADLVWRVPGA